MDRNEAIEVLRKYSPKDAELRKALETAVPELKESEDDCIRRAIISHFVSMTTSCTEEEIQRRKYIAWLEKQKSVEWSEEDNNMITSITKYLNASTAGFPNDVEWAKKFIEWLKSLKPQNHWKPTKQQMEAIKHVAEQNRASEIGNILDNLLVEIKNM